MRKTIMAGTLTPSIPNPTTCPIGASLSSISHSLCLSDPNLRPTAMATSPLHSALTSTISDSDKAWHLLALLLSLGRRARPSELAAQCTAFPATAHLIERLCSVANSPLSLSEDLHVTPSLLVVTALAESVSRSGAAPGELRTCLGKRKRVVLDCGFVTSAKWRLIVDFENVNEENGARKSLVFSPLKIHFHMTDNLSRRINMLPSDGAMGLNKPTFSSPLFNECGAVPSGCGVKSIENVQDQMDTDVTMQMNVERTVMASVDGLEPTVPTVSEDLQATTHDIDSLAKYYIEKSIQHIFSLDENVSGSCKVGNSMSLEDERIVADSEEELLVNPGNRNGEPENMSQPDTTVSVKIPGIDSRRLEEENYEESMSLRKRLMRILQARGKLRSTDISIAEKQLLQPSEKVSNDLVLIERANMHEKTKESIISPAWDEGVSSSRRVPSAKVVEDVKTAGNDEELFINPGNHIGETENLAQPYAAFSDQQPGTGPGRLKEQEFEGTLPIHKKHMGRHENQTICLASDFSAPKVFNRGNHDKETKNIFQPYSAVSDKLPGIDFRRLNEEDFEVTPPVNRSLETRMKTHTTCPATGFYVPQKQLLTSSATMKAIHHDKISSRLQPLYGCNLEQDQAVATPKVNLDHKMEQKTNIMVHKSKPNCGDMNINERKRQYKAISSKDQPEKKELPNFDSYMVEEEEGSGGYGTVYRARSKNDRTRVAIKCPHANAHKSHVSNELRMLERFGGKNFVIKYEGCIKNGNSSCFVLQHVEHDRPEVLKKEIDVCELRWYGYCLFRALASLHKQGIVHRDVKPGNFLFSRKASKGYLIDFNLSMDLHQKYGNNSKSRGPFDVNSNHENQVTANNLPPITLRKLPSGKSLLTANGDSTKGLKSTFDMKDLKKMAFSQMKASGDSVSGKVIKSQGADGSGITSVKDVTSTRTPSAERTREPLPCQGRKELISLVHEARESPNHGASSISALMRKRVPAPPVNVDGKLFHVTPMPLHSTTNGIGGPCLIRSRGLGKHKEGPCAGTKGFRAPEVLFRSLHQGPKIDIWSAGVTLLYMLIGKTPFLGEPELNIKDIAKLRASEDLWEVAKLHDRESSFPVELYNTDCLPSIKLKEWCRRNTKRPEFFEKIPRPLFDLVDKCLMVNPRLRISAEDALKHEFFAPCHEELRKHRLQKQPL